MPNGKSPDTEVRAPIAPAVRIEGIDVRYDRARAALENVSFSLQRGAIAGVVGPDGAGKSTLLKCLAGLLSPGSGTVELLGLSWEEDRTQLQRRVAYMPQTGSVYDNLTVRENLELFAELYGVPAQSKQTRMTRLLEISGLAPFPDRLARNLSGGMKQKLGLICCLVAAPELLILDEPGVGVDVISRRELWRMYREFAASGSTVVLSTTYMDEADQCDQVVVLDAGRVLFADTPEAFRNEANGRVALCYPHMANARSLAARLIELDGVLDAIVAGNVVRVLLTRPFPEMKEVLTSVCADVEPETPTFGDAFALTLGGVKASTTSLPPFIEESPHESGEATVRVSHVWKLFGRFVAVRDVSFEAYRGEVFGLLGPNGAGKTTLFRMLCGVLPPSRGELLVAGTDATRAPVAMRERIGYMAQKFALYRELSPVENMAFYGRAYGVPGRVLRDRISQLLHSLELKPYAHLRSGDLPLGYKQRLSLACAIVHDPEIVFLDEPTSGVDPLARREFWRLINALAALGRTVLVTTHFMEEAEYCDRVIIMDSGEVVAQGNPLDITAQARRRDPSVRTFEDAFVVLLEELRGAKVSLTPGPSSDTDGVMSRQEGRR